MGDAGDVAPPQPKKDPSLDAPGDFGKGLFVMLESCNSLEYVLGTALGVLILCGGRGLFENIDIVAEGGTLVELESLYHGAVCSDAEVRADSLVNLVCFADGAPAGRVCKGTVGFGVLETVSWVRVVTRSDEVESEVKATCSFESLPKTLAFGRRKNEVSWTKVTYTVSSCCREYRAGVKAAVDSDGNSYKVGLSTEYALTKVWSGNARVLVARCSPDESLVAKGEAVKGKGFRRTDDDEVDDAVEKARDRIVNDGIRGLLPGRSWPGRSGSSSGLLAGRIDEVSRSDGSEV